MRQLRIRNGVKRWHAAVLAVVAVLLLYGSVHAVTVAPLAVYLDSRARSGTLTLFNNGTRTEEVQIDFAFGYPQSDSLGEITVALVPEAPAGEPSAVAWTRAFPQRLVLQPGQRQVVRILAEPPADLQDGEYWGRVLVKSRGGQAPIEQRQGDVTVQLDIETVLALALVYRQGRVGSGVEIAAAAAEQRGDTVVTTVDLRRTGNAAFVGRVVVDLLDDAGRVAATHELPVPVHYELRRVLRMPVTGRVAQARIRVDNQRDDLPAQAPLPMEPLTRLVPVLHR